MIPEPSSDRRLFLRDLALLLGIPAVLLGSLLVWTRPWEGKRYEVPAGTDVFEVVTGLWDAEDADSFCVAMPHAVTFSPDRKWMMIGRDRPWTLANGEEVDFYYYAVLSWTASSVRGRAQTESATTSMGTPVEWDLILTSESTYVWHRSDWPPWQRTNANYRCPQ